MSTHSCNHSTPHTHAAEASHSHGNAPLRNYLVGVILFCCFIGTAIGR